MDKKKSEEAIDKVLQREIQIVEQDDSLTDIEKAKAIAELESEAREELFSEIQEQRENMNYELLEEKYFD